MQWILYLIGYLVLAAAAAAARTASADDAYAPSGSLRDGFLLTADDVRYLYDATRNGFDMDDEGESRGISKRALSVLSRWRPFGNLGARMNSIHKAPSRGTVKMSSSPGMDFVSAETRGSTRPMGQPLRWGRKR